jgi:hypothetical protein
MVVEDSCVLGHDTMLWDEQFPTFGRIILLSFSSVKQTEN